MGIIPHYSKKINKRLKTYIKRGFRTFFLNLNDKYRISSVTIDNVSLKIKIVTTQKYNQLFKSLLEKPYPLILKDTGQTLIYFGHAHTRNPKDGQYKQNKKLFSDFLELAKGKEKIIFVENYLPTLEKTELETIKKHGFSGQNAWLANKKNIPVNCPEPKWEWVLEFTLKEVEDKTLVATWMFLNTLGRFIKNSTVEKENIKEIENSLLYINKSLKTKNIYNKIRKLLIETPYKIKLEKDIKNIWKDSLDYKKIKNIQDPFITKTKINKVGSMINLARDIWITNKILDSLKRGKSVFATFGLNHVLSQKKLFEEYFK